MISEKKLITIITNALDVEEGVVNMNLKSSDIEQWDSLGHLAILSAIAQEFEGQYEDGQQLALSSSVKEIFDFLNKPKS
ncbi:MAG: acyl carrier protein [Alphaproteobacteria bacterium]